MEHGKILNDQYSTAKCLTQSAAGHASACLASNDRGHQGSTGHNALIPTSHPSAPMLALPAAPYGTGMLANVWFTNPFGGMAQSEGPCLMSVW